MKPMPHLPSSPMDAFDYTLPQDAIAEHPLDQRDHSKLLVYKSGKMVDDTFYHLPEHLPQNATIVLNNTRVIAARLYFQKESGGVIEIFCLEPASSSIEETMNAIGEVEFRCLIGGASKWKNGLVLMKKLQIDNKEVGLEARYVAKEDDSFIVAFKWNTDFPFSTIIEAAGAIPLPPYIKRTAVKSDTERYQTVFAQHNGSVAAPTAALHFTPDVFTALDKKNILKQYITLHVGAGTFKPVKTASIIDHQMHSEPFTIRKEVLKRLIEANNIVAVGTTSLRTLESLYWLGVKLLKGAEDFNLRQWEAYNLDASTSYGESLEALLEWLTNKGMDELQCRTSLLIQPGYTFKSAQGLITNFHQPRSTLLLLIAAFIGDDWKKVYKHALENNYRFLSYGDSSLLWRNA